MLVPFFYASTSKVKRVAVMEAVAYLNNLTFTRWVDHFWVGQAMLPILHFLSNNIC
jgi:hypothetical protein